MNASGRPPYDADILRFLVIAAGVGASLSFVVVGLAFGLQTYGDGAIFSYAVAIEDVWAVHWHNIAVRGTVWLLQLLPGEIVVALTGSPQAGVFVYSAMSLAAQALGLAATFLLDRTPRRTFFLFACASTACLCPLVFGFPTEMLLAHALFWPTFALACSARPAKRATALLFALMLALIFTHEAALGLAFGVVMALALHGTGDRRFRRAALCFAGCAVIWLAVNAELTPDSYFAKVRLRAAAEFFDGRALSNYAVDLIAAALAGYGVLVMAGRRLWRSDGAVAPFIVAATLVLVALALWWIGFDRSLHADARYYDRTVLLLGTCGFAALCGLLLARDEGAFTRFAPLTRALDRLEGATVARVATGALAIVLAAHVVETAKFVRAWTQYRDAVRALATGEAADPELGAPFYVSSRRISADINRLSWFSTTPYFSADLAEFRPTRLVVDPDANYFWISCATATASVTTDSPVPAATREMIRVYACAHPR